jgi:hypothetical protein
LPILETRVLVAGQVAVLLGCTEETFLKKRTELEDKFGFPHKVPCFNKWPRAAVMHWIDTCGGTYAGLAGTIPGDDPEIDAAVAELERHYVSAPQLQQVA